MGTFRFIVNVLVFTLTLFVAYLFTPYDFEMKPFQTSKAPSRTGVLEVNDRLLEAEIINTRK